MSEAVETNPIQDLIKYSLDQDFTKAGKTFGEIMTLKMNDVLDQEKIRLSDQIYNGVEDDEKDEEQLELDVGTDESDDTVSGESSEDQGGDEEGSGTDDEAEDEPEETEKEESDSEDVDGHPV